MSWHLSVTFGAGSQGHCWWQCWAVLWQARSWAGCSPCVPALSTPSPSPLTRVDIPDLDAAVAEAGGEQQLVLPELEAVPLDVDAAALLVGHGGAEGQAPHDVPAVQDVLAGLVPLGLAALPRAHARAAILGAVQEAANTAAGTARSQETNLHTAQNKPSPQL